VLAHIVFHMPVVAMEKIPLVKLGQTLSGKSGVRIRALGAPTVDGKVPYDCSYQIDISGCPTLLFIGPTLNPKSVEPSLDADVMIVSSRNPSVPSIVAKLEPDLVLFDDVFLPQEYANTPRVRLKNLHQMQRALLPAKSVVLGPGESWTVVEERAPK